MNKLALKAVGALIATGGTGPMVTPSNIDRHKQKGGTAECACGKTISANKTQCWACMQKATA